DAVIKAWLIEAHAPIAQMKGQPRVRPTLWARPVLLPARCEPAARPMLHLPAKPAQQRYQFAFPDTLGRPIAVEAAQAAFRQYYSVLGWALASEVWPKPRKNLNHRYPTGIVERKCLFRCGRCSASLLRHSKPLDGEGRTRRATVCRPAYSTPP